MKKRVVIAGFGDTGVLVAIHLGKQFDIVGISPKPCLVSGQELGTRLTQPESWKQNYLMSFRRYKKLDHVRTVQGLITAIDSKNSRVTVTLEDGSAQDEHYDALLISSGVSNGFWRNNAFEELADIQRNISTTAQQMKQAGVIAVVGGGASGVSVSANIARQYPDKEVHLFYSQQQLLPGYHPRVRTALEHSLHTAGVNLHPNHRAIIAEGFGCDQLSTDAIAWSTGQPSFQADVTLWAVGNTRPNNAFIPDAMLNNEGFVKTQTTLRVAGFDNIFAVGDIAATDPNRSSARNWGFRLAAHNIRAFLSANESAMRHFSASPYRWGSILGVQTDGLRVFQPNGGSFRFAKWAVKTILFPLMVRKMIYKGVRNNTPPQQHSQQQDTVELDIELNNKIAPQKIID